MAVPWLRLIDAAINMGDVVRRVRGRNAPIDETRALAQGSTALGGLEARLAGVVVAALKEAFDRDNQRLALEREKQEEERQRAERALKLELLRQAGERELSRLRWIAGAAIAAWAASLFLTSRLLASTGGRLMLGAGWALLIIAMACAFAEQSRIARSIAVADDRLSVESATAPGAAGVAAPWLVAAGFLAVTLATLF